MSDKILTITRANIDHAAVLTQLSVATFLEAFAADNKKEDMDKYIAEAMSLPQLTSELNDTGNLFFLVWYNGTLAGYAKMSANSKAEAAGLPQPIELERIYVLKEYYGMQIGAALMNYCLTYAINFGYKTIWLGVWENNHRAVRFYKQWGFETFGTHEFVLGDDIQTDQLMMKAL